MRAAAKPPRRGGRKMLNEKKLREKVEELKQQKLQNYIEWEEELHKSDNPLTD